jgi:hypothetical protein
MSLSYLNPRPGASSPVPYSEQIEAAVLACINDPRCSDWPDVLTPSLFYDVRHGTILEAAEIVRKEGKRPEPLNLIECLKAHNNLEAAGGLTYVAGLPEQCTSPENFRDWVADLEQYAARRKAILEAQERISLAQDVSKPFLDASLPPGLDERLQARLFDVAQQPDEPVPRYSINGIPVSTAGNLTVYSAAPKSGKSAIVGAKQAAVMSNGRDGDFLGFSSSNPEGHAVIAFDTEQSLLDHWKCNQRNLRRAGIDHPPAWFQSYCLTGFNLTDCQAALTLTAKRAKEQFGGIHSIFLDGGADFISDVNDPIASNEFVARLHGMAVDYNCSIITIIHLNPLSAKTRGHFGSQLERKAETNLTIEADGDAFVLYGLKNRRAPITRNNGPRFAWNDEAGMFLSVQSAGDVERLEQIEEHSPMVAEIFAETKAFTHTGLIKRDMSLNRKCERTAKRNIKLWCQLGLIRKTPQGHYVSNV